MAIRQILSRDAHASTSEISVLGANLDLDPAEVAHALGWLTMERIVVSLDDCRTPHQRFAAVAMHQVLIASSDQERRRLYGFVSKLLVDLTFPLLGVRNLLHEFRFGHGDYNWAWSRPFSAETVRTIADRCFRAESSELRGHAGLVLTELSAFDEAWGPAIIAPHVRTLAEWMSDPSQGGLGLARLHNHLWSEHRSLQLELTQYIDAEALGCAFSQASYEDIYGIGDLVQSTRNGGDGMWTTRLAKALQQDLLLDRIQRWNRRKDIWLVAHTCYAVAYYDSDLALTLMEAYLPTLKSFLASDPVGTFHAANDIFMGVLRLDDPLGSYVGKFAPDARSRAIGKAMCANLNPGIIAAKVSETRLRDFQEAASFLVFLKKCAPRKYDDVIEAIDWDRLNASIGEAWRDPPHELQVLCGSFYRARKHDEPIADFIARNADRIESMPPRLALIAPNACLAHLDAGKPITLVKWQHVEWTFGTMILHLVAEERPALMRAVLEPHIGGIAHSLSQPNASWFTQAGGFLWTLRTLAPGCLAAVLDAIDAAPAAKGWADSLKNGGGAAEAVAVLVDAAQDRTDDVGALARAMRKRFPTTSKAPKRC